MPTVWESTEWQCLPKIEAALRDTHRGAREDQNDDFQRMKLGANKEEKEGDFAEKAYRCDVKSLENHEFPGTAETWRPGSINTQNYTEEKNLERKLEDRAEEGY